MGGGADCCWLVRQNPLGDAVVERCLEVLGRYNNTLEQLDVHGTSISREALEKASLLLPTTFVAVCVLSGCAPNVSERGPVPFN